MGLLSRKLRTFGKVLSSPEFRIACSGCWVFFLSVGLIRGLTVVQDALTIFFEVDATTIMSISASLLAAYAVGGLASGYIIPKCGVRYPTIFSGLSCSLGISLCGMLLWTKSIILMVVILFFLVGLPQGVAINAVLGSAKSNVQSKYMGLVMTLVGGGISVASLILPLVFTKFCAAVGNCHNVERNEGIYVPVVGLDKLFFFIGGLMFIMVPSGIILLEKDHFFQNGQITNSTSSKTSRKPNPNSSTSDSTSRPSTNSSSENSDTSSLIPRKSSKSEEDQIENAEFWSWNLLAYPHFSVHLLGQLIFFSAYFAMFPLAADMLNSIGFERNQEIPFLLLILGIVELCSRVFYAFCLADRFDKIKLMGFTYLGDGLGFLILMAAYYSNSAPEMDRDLGSGFDMENGTTSYYLTEMNEFQPDIITTQDFNKEATDKTMKWVFTLLAFIIGGFFNAGFGGLINAALVEIVPAKSYATAVGMQALAIGIGETVGPFIGGAVADASVPIERLAVCNGIDWHDKTLVGENQKAVVAAGVDSGLRMTDKEYFTFIENGGKIDWDSYCEKEYWQCFVVGSAGMLMSAVCVGVMKWLWEAEKKKTAKQAEQENDV